jgi:hypothetical protein
MHKGLQNRVAHFIVIMQHDEAFKAGASRYFCDIYLKDVLEESADGEMFCNDTVVGIKPLWYG